MQAEIRFRVMRVNRMKTINLETQANIKSINYH